jgi:cytochrome c1
VFKNKNIIVLVAFINALFASSSTLAQSSDGELLFSNNCMQCHRNAAVLRTDTDAIAAKLKKGNIRPHRFSLTDSEIDKIVQYLKINKQ